jgi:hypothetical protein
MDQSSPFPQGKPLRLDPDAESADPGLPAFIARPQGAPVYHGFPLLEESRTADGWCFGMISDPNCSEGCDEGDAFVVAPDNTRAGLIWHVGPLDLQVSLEPESDRWGVYDIGIADTVHSQAELVKQLQTWLPELQRRHTAWIASQVERGPRESAKKPWWRFW